MANLSVVVITYNEEANIERCLRSVQWADEIIVVDSFSTDKTVERAHAFTEKIILHQYDGEVTQRERGCNMARSEWVLWIDADEEVSPELKMNIEGVIANPDAADGYVIARKVYALGRWIEHGGWFPDWQFRLARKDKLVPEYQEIHGNFTTHGRKERLGGLLYHYTYSTIAEHLRKMNDQTSLHVSNKLKDHPDIDVRWWKIVFSPFSYFVRMFIIKRGYKDGIAGFVLAVNSALYTLLVYAKTWEYQMRMQEGKGILPPITNSAIQQLKRFTGN